MDERRRARVLTIAGSDSGGGAGIQADLKTFSALGVFGMSAITSVTAQNTVGVRGVHDLPSKFVAQQIDAVLEDIGADAVKTGMLSNAEIIEAVCDRLVAHRVEHLVVDPVMVATSGDRLLREDAVRVLCERLMPLAEVVTPNLPEAEALTGIRIESEEAIGEAAKRIHGMGARFVFIKGGHAEGADAVDYLYDGAELSKFSLQRVDTRNTHGTGCTLSAAIAVHLALGKDVRAAVGLAKAYVTGALNSGLAIGKGRGPLDHEW